MLSKDELLRLKADARLYDGKLLKRTGAAVYNEIVWAREVKDDAIRLLNILVHEDGDAAMPENSVPPGRGDHALTLPSLKVEKTRRAVFSSKFSLSKLHFHLSHQIFWLMHGSLNIGK